MATINVGQSFKNVVPNFVDVKGRPAKVDPNKPLVWASSDETQLLPVTNADGTEDVKAVAPSSPGTTARIACTGDADLGDGFEPVTIFSEDVTVNPDPNAKAVGGGISLGTPVDNP